MPKPILHQIHPILPVENVVDALTYYVKKLGFTIAFADDSKLPTYAGVRRDGIEIHLEQHQATPLEVEFPKPMLRIVTEHVESLYEEYKYKKAFHENIKLRATAWQTREFTFNDLYENRLTFYQNL
ncbi:glyoxalase superfamily protein [Lacinutrix neustonica]|uniref:Bleomycin resistance protein n=1 Tax=Lacinutrix neustonica TaxID=2980107 RepID=A0A9E8MUP9_9FLAO|nr:glyoxalase superfamily protein [Lacinutrix neustonica]WAC01838.1 glyoxalase superfamily protein [Lacinutrix neustonica]